MLLVLFDSAAYDLWPGRDTAGHGFESRNVSQLNKILTSFKCRLIGFLTTGIYCGVKYIFLINKWRLRINIYLVGSNGSIISPSKISLSQIQTLFRRILSKIKYLLIILWVSFAESVHANISLRTLFVFLLFFHNITDRGKGVFLTTSSSCKCVLFLYMKMLIYVCDYRKVIWNGFLAYVRWNEAKRKWMAIGGGGKLAQIRINVCENYSPSQAVIQVYRIHSWRGNINFHFLRIPLLMSHTRWRMFDSKSVIGAFRFWNNNSRAH